MSIAPRSRTQPAAAPATPQVRTRTPAAPARAATPAAGWMKSGSNARAAAEAEITRQREAAERRASGVYMPFRLWVPVGGSTEVVVLDNELGPCFYEHQIQNPKTGKWDLYETCPKEWEPCPLCEKLDKESYYVMMLSVIELRSYTKKDGTVVPFSRKLLPIKAQQQGFFMRQFDRHGSLRGLHLLLSRDTQTTPSIGNPEFVEKHSEEEILSSFGHAAVVGQDGKVVKDANADCFAYPYDKLFKKPTAEDLRKRYGGIAPAGSREDLERDWGQGQAGAVGDAVDEIPFDDEQPAA